MFHLAKLLEKQLIINFSDNGGPEEDTHTANTHIFGLVSVAPLAA